MNTCDPRGSTSSEEADEVNMRLSGHEVAFFGLPLSGGEQNVLELKGESTQVLQGVLLHKSIPA